jgi:hypothetical protein
MAEARGNRARKCHARQSWMGFTAKIAESMRQQQPGSLSRYCRAFHVRRNSKHRQKDKGGGDSPPPLFFLGSPCWKKLATFSWTPRGTSVTSCGSANLLDVPPVALFEPSGPGLPQAAGVLRLPLPAILQSRGCNRRREQLLAGGFSPPAASCPTPMTSARPLFNICQAVLFLPLRNRL